MIEFRPITKENYMECIFLKTSAVQRSFVADNAQSIIESFFEEGLFTRAIYDDDQMVGFLLYDYDVSIPGWSLSRFMIGEEFQGKGIGKRALQGFLEYCKTELKLDTVYLSVSVENKAAYGLFRSIGFEDVQPIQYFFNGIEFREIQMVKRLG